jgi:hypothetical protein
VDHIVAVLLFSLFKQTIDNFVFRRFANLRSECYGMSCVSQLEARRIAGRIVPALVTTTACVAGLALLQLAWLRAAPLAREALRNYFVNLALSAAV